MKEHTQEQQQALLPLIFQVLKGKKFDYTQGSLRHAVILLAIPMVLEMSMESVFAVVDIFFVSGLGSEAVAVVGLTEAVITLIYALAFGLGLGVTAVVSRRIGENDYERAALTSGQVLIIGIVLSALVGIIGILFPKEILILMGAEEEVAAMGSPYMQWMLGGSLTIFYLFIISAIFRGAGNAIIAMYALWIANGINIILDPCLIYGWWIFPELGLDGAAIATNIGRGIGSLYLLYHLFKGESRVQLVLKHLKFSALESFSLIRISAGGIMQFFFATASWVVLIRFMANFGSEALAAYTIAMRIATFTFLPAWGLSNATATLVGQNLGAKDPKRAEESVWLTNKYNAIFMAVVGVLLLVFARPLTAIFTDSEVVLDIGIDILRIIALGYPFYALGMVMTQAFNGAGDTTTPTWINFLSFWIIQIPLAWALAFTIEWQSLGVATAVPLAEIILAIIAWWQFRKGKWKHIQV